MVAQTIYTEHTDFINARKSTEILVAAFLACVTLKTETMHSEKEMKIICKHLQKYNLKYKPGSTIASLAHLCSDKSMFTIASHYNSVLICNLHRAADLLDLLWC